MPLTRLSLEERIRLVRLYSMYEKATHIQKAWKKEFGTDPPSRKTIAALNKKFDETGSVADLSRSGRPKSSRTEEKVALVTAALKKDPSRSIRSLSTELGVNKAAVHRIKQETERKKSLLGAEIRRLKEKIQDLQRRLATEGQEGHKGPANPAPAAIADDHCMSEMDQYMIEKHEMFESTLIEDDQTSSDIQSIISVPSVPKMDMATASMTARANLLAANNANRAEALQGAGAQLTARVAAVMGGLNLPNGSNQGMLGKSVEDDIKSFEAAMAHELHHPNNCPQHNLGCHMCYITSVN